MSIMPAWSLRRPALLIKHAAYGEQRLKFRSERERKGKHNRVSAVVLKGQFLFQSALIGVEGPFPFDPELFFLNEPAIGHGDLWIRQLYDR